MKKIDKLLDMVRPAPPSLEETLLEEFDFDALNIEESEWLLSYLKSYLDKDIPESEDPYLEVLLDKMRTAKAASTNGTA